MRLRLAATIALLGCIATPPLSAGELTVERVF